MPATISTCTTGIKEDYTIHTMIQSYTWYIDKISDQSLEGRVDEQDKVAIGDNIPSYRCAWACEPVINQFV